MSGVGEVSLILAILPLVVSIAENYQKVLKPVSRYTKFEAKLRGFKARLVTQESLYWEEFGLLLRRALSCERTALSMIADRTDPFWNDASVGAELKSYLGRSSAAFEACVADIDSHLKLLSEHIDNFTTVAKKQLKDADPDQKTSSKKLAKKLKFCFSESKLENILESLDQRSLEFRTIVQQEERKHKADEGYLTGHQTCARRSRTSNKSYQRIQDDSNVLFEKLSVCCDRHDRHQAHLSLVPRTEDKCSYSIWFQLIFSRPIPAQGARCIRLEVESVMNTSEIVKIDHREQHDRQGSVKRTLSNSTASSKSQSREEGPGHFTTCSSFKSQQPTIRKRKHVKFEHVSAQSDNDRSEIGQPMLLSGDFCNYILTHCSHSTQSRVCVGFCDVSGGQQLRFHVQGSFEQGKLPQTNTLSNIFTVIKKQRLTGRLSEHERFRFARLLAVAALQFYNTPWIKYGGWRSHDLMLWDGGKMDSMLDSPLTTPCMEVTVSREDANLSSHRKTGRRPWIKDPVLFGLSLFLIELASEKPLRELQQASEHNDPNDVEYETADRLLDAVAGVTSLQYRAVVWKCLSNFGSTEDLTSETMRGRYHHEVICVLRDLEKQTAVGPIKCECQDPDF